MNKLTIRDVGSTYHMSEGVKTMRTNLLFSREDTKVILVTSSVAGEGKSSIAMELCKSLAEIDKKVLLIDADMRKTVLVTRLSGANRQLGLSHFLSGQAKVSEIIAATNVKNFHIVVGGPTVQNSAELLSGPLFAKLLESFREYYDYIIIDGAPVGLVIDSAIIGEHCDASVFVVESKKVKYKFAQKSIAALEASGCPVLGVVVNKYDMKSAGEYYKKYYYKEYQE